MKKTRNSRCIFCDVLLTKSPVGSPRSSDKAKEHVLKKSFITELGHDATKVYTDIHAGHELIDKRNLYAQGYLAGEVCRGCNCGWIDELDISVAHIVLAAARSAAQTISFTDIEAVALSRWLLKMACALESTDASDRRHIPEQVRLSVRRPGYLPPNFISFYGKLPPPVHELGPAIVDMWPCRAPVPVALTAGNQSKRLKFGVQYDHAVFGCAYVDEPGIAFEGVSGVHNKIFVSSDTSLLLSMNPDLCAITSGPLKHSFADTKLNRFLAAMKADKPIYVLNGIGISLEHLLG